jgi:hypothetical protein
MMKFLHSVAVVASFVALTKAQNSEVNSPSVPPLLRLTVQNISFAIYFLSVNGRPNELTSYAVRSCGGVNIISINNFGMRWVLFHFDPASSLSTRRYRRSTHSVEFMMVGTATQDGLSPTSVLFRVHIGISTSDMWSPSGWTSM